MIKPVIDRDRFGPWALITGASSGIGHEFARQIASSGINLVLVARREALLQRAGTDCAREYGVDYRVIVADLSKEGFLDQITEGTSDLDIGLIISNAGTGSAGKFLTKSLNEMENLLRLNTVAHLNLAHYFGPKLIKRRRGGMLFVGAMGAEKGIPYMANDAAAKAYVQSFAHALHVEWKSSGIHVTVLPPAPTQTPVLAKLGLDPRIMPIKPMKVEQCVDEGLRALVANRALIIPGRLNRIMNALVPPSVVRAMMAKLFENASQGISSRVIRSQD
jgi:short-subunit dehydrogenase